MCHGTICDQKPYHLQQCIYDFYTQTKNISVITVYPKIYHKRQNLSERKSLQFSGFHPDVGKTVAVFALPVIESANCSTEHLTGKLSGFSKIPENYEFFYRSTFAVYSIKFFVKTCSYQQLFHYYRKY